MQETGIRSLGWDDPLEKEMAAHSSILAWKIPWMGNLVGYCPWGRKESDTTEQREEDCYSSTTSQTTQNLNGVSVHCLCA